MKMKKLIRDKLIVDRRKVCYYTTNEKIVDAKENLQILLYINLSNRLIVDLFRIRDEEF